MKHPYLWWRKCVVEYERRHAVEEGRDIAPLAGEFASLQAAELPEDEAFQRRVNELMDRVAQLPIRGDFPYREPSDLEGIRAERPAGPRRLELKLTDEALLDRLHGAWLGRCAGCLLGKPIEGVRTDALWGLLKDAGRDGLSDYLWRMDISEELFAKYKLAERVLNFGRSVQHMPEDDDTNYTVTALAIVKKHGLGFTSEDVGDFWIHNIPLMHTCTAERIAYRNFTANVLPPASAAFRNPCREWIGAQIRADFFGYLAVGDPQLAAELAWRDACISHTRNGIYGEMWVAAMLAAATATDDPAGIIEIGLSEVPARSRFTEAIRDVLAWRKQGLSYAQAVDRIHKRWNEHDWHDWHHTIANAQLVAIALLWGGADLGEAITRAVYPCFDTDCNGATAGSVAGMMLGASRLKGKWTNLMNDTLHTGVSGYHVVRISDLAAETLKLHKANRT
jgi:hypothetical protein